MIAPLWRQLADRLTTEIRSGQREPGSKVPSYGELAEQRLSQATVARAYRELIEQGLLVAVHGAGTFVANPVPPTPTSETDASTSTRVAALEAEVAALKERLDRLAPE